MITKSADSAAASGVGKTLSHQSSSASFARVLERLDHTWTVLATRFFLHALATEAPRRPGARIQTVANGE